MRRRKRLIGAGPVGCTPAADADPGAAAGHPRPSSSGGDRGGAAISHGAPRRRWPAAVWSAAGPGGRANLRLHAFHSDLERYRSARGQLAFAPDARRLADWCAGGRTFWGGDNPAIACRPIGTTPTLGKPDCRATPDPARLPMRVAITPGRGVGARKAAVWLAATVGRVWQRPKRAQAPRETTVSRRNDGF